MRPVPLAPLALALLFSCTSSPEATVPSAPLAPGAFPKGFLFGSATAGFQCDMGCPTLPREECEDAASDWFSYVTSPDTKALARTYLEGTNPSDVSPGHWELFESDHALARDELHNNSFRLSIEWSRIFPSPTDDATTHEELAALANPKALATYRAMFESLRANGLAPFVTLHHYTLPSWIHDGVGCTLDLENCTARGWLDEVRIVREMAKYAGFVAREFGGEVDLWATQNEPFAVLVSAYLQPSAFRSNPPAVLLKSEEARTALFAMIEAHARAVDAVRENDTVDADGDGKAAQVGVVYAVAPIVPEDPDNPLDVQAAKNIDYLWNLLYLDATANGSLDVALDGAQVRTESLTGRMDFLGVNFKKGATVQGTESSILPSLTPLLTFNPLSYRYDRLVPRELYDTMLRLHERYGLPIYLAENNGQQIPLGDEAGEVKILVENLQWLSRAIRDGVDVRGYFYWSFMDNYEWNHGMTFNLGLYAVDPADPTRARTPRATVPAYASIAEAGRIPKALLEAHPIAP